MSDRVCPYLISTVNLTGQSEMVCITDVINTFPNSKVILDVDSGSISNLYEGLSVFWMLVAGTLSFFMQLGFAMLEVGRVSRKNIQHVLFKNLMDSSIGTVVWLFVGYGFAWGNG